MSRLVNDGGPAFPQTKSTGPVTNSTTEIVSLGGMTLRDWFAGRALSGLVFHNDFGARSDKEIANGAYAYADAMILPEPSNL